MEVIQEDLNLSEEHENEETPPVASEDNASELQPTGDTLTTETQEGQEGLMSVDKSDETYNSSTEGAAQNARNETEETSLIEKNDIALNDVNQPESSELTANSDLLKDSAPQEISKEDNAQSLPVISDEQPQIIQSANPVIGKSEDDPPALKEDIERKEINPIVFSVAQASSSERVDNFNIKPDNAFQARVETENMSAECELNEKRILKEVEKHLTGEESKSISTFNDESQKFTSGLLTSDSSTPESTNIKSGQLEEQTDSLKVSDPLDEPELLGETLPLHESEPVPVSEPEPKTVNEPLQENDSISVSHPESMTVNELEPVHLTEHEPVQMNEPESMDMHEPEPMHMNEPEHVPILESLSVPVNEPEPVSANVNEPVAVNKPEPPRVKESLKEPGPMTELPELFDTEPAKSSISENEPKELLLTNASDHPSTLVANVKQGPGTEKHELMHVEDMTQTPKVLASMPSLAPITDPPIVYSSTDSVVKQVMRSSIQPGILKDTNQKILKDILPQAEGQQILQIPQSAPAIFIQTPTPVLTPIRQIDPGIAHVQKKDVSETDDLATLANAALGDQAANGMKITEEPSKKEPVWCDVGIIRGTSCHVMSYYEPPFSHDQEHENISSDNIPDYTNSFKIELEPGTAYKFRVCAINSCGRGPWSEVSAFKTCLPGYPGAPSSIKISKSAEGAHLSWEPPSNPAGNIIEYSVCLAVRNPPQGHGDQKGQQLAFVRVYSGPHNQTVVPNSSLAAAHIDTTSKPAIIFRIAAKNEKGFGPATQVRWLQDVVASPTGGMKPVIKKEALASGIPMKRTKLDDF